jgi:phage gp36-like protein
MSNAYDFVASDVLARFTEDELEQLTDGVGSFDSAKVDQAIRDGAGEFDGWVSRYYEVPVTPLTEFIRTSLLDLVAWRLVFNCKREWLNDGGEKALIWAKRRAELLKWMQDVGSVKRDAVLAGCTERATPAAPKGMPKAVAGVQQMTRGKLLKLA